MGAFNTGAGFGLGVVEAVVAANWSDWSIGAGPTFIGTGSAGFCSSWTIIIGTGELMVLFSGTGCGSLSAGAEEGLVTVVERSCSFFGSCIM